MGFSLPFFKKKSSNSLFFGLYLTDATAYGFVFDTSNGAPNIVAFSSCSFTTGFDKILEDIDNLISELELKSSLHLDKTIFFLHSWMIDEQTYDIKEPYKEIIKNLAKDLELEPLGYIDVQDAFHEYIKKESIVNTVALEVNKSKIGVFVYKGGKKVHEQYTARTDNVGEDVNAVLESLPKQILLPPKILVYGDTDKAEVSSELATYEWAEAIFSQHPTIEVIKQPELNQTLATTFSQEDESQAEAAQETAKSVAEPVVPSTVTQPQQDEGQKNEHFGFVMGQDVIAEGAPRPAKPAQAMPAAAPSDTAGGPSAMEKMKSLFSFSMPSVSTGATNKKPFIMGVAVIVFVITLFAIYEYFLHTLHITVHLKAQQFEETVDLDLPIKETQSNELAVLKHITVSKFSEEKKTTGSREIGEKATGEVIIHNFDNSERTFARGTELRKGDLVFSIDSEVKVASSSGVTSDGVKESGKAKVAATASEIGPEYNIAKGTQMQVSSLSDSLYLAIVDAAFTGGSKEKVTTVSTNDLDSLRSNAEEKAKSNTKDVLGTQISDEEIVLSDMTVVALADTTFSGEVGEEAESLKIDAESEIEYFTVQKKPLLEQLQTLLAGELEEGYKIDPSNLTYEIEDIDPEEETVYLEIDASGLAHKEVDMEMIKNGTTRKAISSLQEKIAQEFDIERIEVQQLNIPLLSAWTPFFPKNITVSTSVDK